MASFPLMKLLPAKYVIEKAIREKVLKKGDIVAETSSGTYALGLAMICAEHGIASHIVSDPVIDQDLRQQLEHLGGEVEIVQDLGQGYQVSRLSSLRKYLVEHPNAFWPQQYDNPEHLQAYAAFADNLIKNIGEDFTLVASVGSGSSSCGTMLRLRTYNPRISLVGVDTFGSILFGLKNGTRMLRGLGNSIMPKNLIHSLFDQVHWISASQAYYATQDLYKGLALYVGATTGACYQVAKWIAEQHPQRKVVFISADMGYRYASTVYNNFWMREIGYMRKIVNPIRAERLDDVNNSDLQWGYMDWNRTSLTQVLRG